MSTMTIWPEMYELNNEEYQEGSILGIRVKETIDENYAPMKSKSVFGPKKWEVQKTGGGIYEGSWKVTSKGVLSGRTNEEGPTILWYTQGICGAHMIEFQAATVPPYRSDVNCLWSGNGKYVDAESAVSGGIGGWFPKIYSGIELENSMSSWVETGPLTAGRTYNLAAGRITVRSKANEPKPIVLDFLFVDGKLVMQTQSPPGGYAGVSPWCSSQVALSTWNSHLLVYAYRVSQIEAVWS